MQRWLGWGLLFGLSGALWAQQGSAPIPPPSSSSSSSQSPDSSSGSDQRGSGQSNPPAANSPAESAPPNKDLPKKARVPNLAAPRSDRVQVDDLNLGVGESSSKDTATDLSAPADDAKVHPQSSAAVAEAEAEASGGGITEFHIWDPHKAAKSVEVGDFYFKRKNYRAAEDRYREALRYKDNDAVATIRLAVCLEKLAVWDDARAEYESYLRILPHGPQAVEAQKAIDRLKAQTAGK
jgi:tetratricopeptide (TPR) repeat protein